MSIDNGGPAFPLDLTVEGDHRWGYGMMLRDYFAAKVLPSFVSKLNPEDSDNIERAATLAYAYADEMIEARKVKK
jgi:hypothetical protein